MATKSNVIELNGVKYDALTGEILGAAKRVERRVQPMQVRPHPAPGVRHTRSHSHASHTEGARHQRSAGAVSMDGMVRHRTPNLHLAAHQTQPTKTLMRRAVKAPHANQASHHAAAPKIQPSLPVHTKTGVPASAVMRTRLSANQVDPMRARRADKTPRSGLVQHFKPMPAAAKPHPVQAHAPAATPVAPSATVAAPKPAAPTTHHRVAVQTLTNRQRTQQQQSAQSNMGLTHHRPAAHPAAAHTTHHKTQEDDDHDIFAQALAHATSHQEKAPKESLKHSARRRGKKLHRVLGVAASVAVFVALCGFVAYQNKTNIMLQLASAKAGFSASVPLYKPAGYSIGKLDYGTGAVAVTYQKGSDNKFDILQKKSNWDSQTLLENFVATSNEPYQGYQAGGRTIYVYGKGKATWVNGGIWYQIQDANNLTDEQIVKVAASM